MSTTVHLSLGADGRTYSVKPFSLDALDELKEALTPILTEFDRSIEAMPEEPDKHLTPEIYRDHMYAAGPRPSDGYDGSYQNYS